MGQGRTQFVLGTTRGYGQEGAVAGTWRLQEFLLHEVHTGSDLEVLPCSNINLNNLMIVKKLLSMAKNKIKTGKKVKIKFVKDRPGHDLRYAINSNKIRKEIRWKPKININIGLEKTLDWYLDNQKYYSSLKKKDITRRLGNKK